MRFAVLFGCILAVGASLASGQVRVETVEEEGLPPDVETVTHGEFAAMVLRMFTGDPETELDPQIALTELQNRGLIPPDWEADGILTHRELTQFLLRLGITAIEVLEKYNPPDPDKPASQDWVEVMLRRAISEVKEFTYTYIGPVVSPYDFQ